MSFIVATDTSANLQKTFIEKEDVRIIPYIFRYRGEEHTCFNVEDFDIDGFFEMMRQGEKVETSQVNPFTYEQFFEKLLQENDEVLFISMSSGISGSFNSAVTAKNNLMERYPDKKLYLVDTLGASLGEGLFVVKACEYRAQGKVIEEVNDRLLKERYCMYQIFTVDDLKYLRNTGRLSRAVALIGSLLNIKPLLKGDMEGKIVNFAITRGRKKVLLALAKRYEEYVVDPEDQIIGIAHADCLDDAKFLIDEINKRKPPKEIMLVDYEPVTGSHVGPGTLALFFMSNNNVREK